MYVSAENIQPEKVEIEELTASTTGEVVTVEGEVVSSSFRDGNLFLTVKDDTGELKVANFNSQKNFQEGDNVAVSGQVTLYEGEVEIIADSIELK